MKVKIINQDSQTREFETDFVHFLNGNILFESNGIQQAFLVTEIVFITKI